MNRFAIAYFGALLAWPVAAGAQDPASARFQEACDAGDGSACVVLGMMYERGAGVSRNAPRAVTLYRTACDLGDLRGCVNLGVLVEAGVGAERNVERARELYARACDGGQPTACDLLEELDRGGTGGPTTYFKTGRVADADTDAPLPGALVQLPGLGIRAITDDDGRVSLGRVPEGRHAILVERFGYEAVDGVIEVPGNAEFVVLLPPASISDPLARGRIVGRVTEAAGGSLSNVETSIAGEPAIRALSNGEGRFELRGVTPGLVEVRLSLLGYATRTTEVVLQPGATVELAATMSQQAIELEPIEVMVRSGYLDRSGFYRRAQRGWGTHFGPEDIERIDPFDAADLIRFRVPGVRVLPNGAAVSRRGFSMSSGDCMLSVFVDGAPSMLSLQDIPTEWLDAVEVYHGVGTPIEYQFNNACGVVLIWTRR